MSRIIWSVGGTGLVLAGLAVAWLHRPLEPSPLEGPAPVALAPRPPPSAEPHPASPPPDTVAPTPRPPPIGDSLDTDAPAPPEPPPSPARARRKPSPTRQRVVAALRGEHASPEQRRDAVLSELMATGDSREPWTGEAQAALETWRARTEEEVLPVRAEPARCFAAGCVARVTFPDAASFEAASQHTAGLRLGTGGAHLQLPPERLPSGEVVTSWVVLRPDAP